MKVLQVNCVYKRGSTGKIVNDLHNSLRDKGIKSIVCYGRGVKVKEPFVYKTSSEFSGKFNNIKSRFTGMPYNGSFLATNKLLKIIKKENPDIVHLHCINGFFINIYKIIEYLKISNIKTVLTLHAEFMYTGGCGHSYDCESWKNGCGKCPQLREATNSYFLDETKKNWIKMKKAFEGFDNIKVVSVSPWLESRAKQSPILRGKSHCTILNGIDNKNIFKPTEYAELKTKHRLKDERLIIHVTANFKSNAKGGQYILELARRIEDKNIKIIVIGNQDNTVNIPNNVIDVGRVENQIELAKYYSMGDLTVITSKKETFSMVCAESLSCGTPVIGFRAGGPEQISLDKYSEFVEYGDVNSLEKCIYTWINKKESIKSSIRNNSNEFYSKEKMCDEYIRVYTETVDYKSKGDK